MRRDELDLAECDFYEKLIAIKLRIKLNRVKM